MRATWYSSGFLSEPRAEIREAVGIQFDLGTCQACNEHVDDAQSPKWAEEDITDGPEWTWIHQLSSMWAALPLKAWHFAVHTRAVQTMLLFRSLLSSTQTACLRFLSEFPSRKQSYLKKFFTHPRRLAATYGEVGEEVERRESGSEVELQGISLGWHPAFLTKFQIPSREDRDWGWCWLHVWGFSKTPLTALDDGDKE